MATTLTACQSADELERPLGECFDINHLPVGDVKGEVILQLRSNKINLLAKGCSNRLTPNNAFFSDEDRSVVWLFGKKNSTENPPVEGLYVFATISAEIYQGRKNNVAIVYAISNLRMTQEPDWKKAIKRGERPRFAN